MSIDRERTQEIAGQLLARMRNANIGPGANVPIKAVWSWVMQRGVLAGEFDAAFCYLEEAKIIEVTCGGRSIALTKEGYSRSRDL